MNLKDTLLTRFKKEFSKDSYVNHYFPIYIVFNILIVLCLLYSAFASYSYYKALLSDLNNFWGVSVSFLFTCLISALIYYFTSHVARTWFTYYKVDIVCLFLAVAVGWNVYTDLLGVESVSENMNPENLDIQTSNLDENYRLTIANFDAQIKDNARLIRLNEDFSKKLWGWKEKQQKYNDAKRSKERIEKQKGEFLKQYSKQRAKSIDLHTTKEERRLSKIDRQSSSLKGVATVCMVVTILCSFWCANYKKKVKI